MHLKMEGLLESLASGLEVVRTYAARNADPVFSNFVVQHEISQHGYLTH